MLYPKALGHLIKCFALFQLSTLTIRLGAIAQPVVGVDDSLPGDGLRVDVEVGELVLLVLGQLVGIGFVDAKLLQTPDLKEKQTWLNSRSQSLLWLNAMLVSSTRIEKKKAHHTVGHNPTTSRTLICRHGLQPLPNF